VAEEKAKIEADIDKIRQQRAKEREERAAQAAAAAPVKSAKKPEAPRAVEKKAGVPIKSTVDRILDTLVWVHRRNR
jgi:hypothetical protein